jgi:flagellar basal-body rod modification protein FlgD
MDINSILSLSSALPLKGVSATDTSELASPTIADGPKTFGTSADFLKLLIEQIKAQDPMDPMDSNQFTQQLVAYNQLQEAITLNQNIEDMKANEDLAQGSQLIGLYVEGLDANNTMVSGYVDSVQKVDGEVTVLVGDQMLLLSQIYTVAYSEPVVE